MENCGAITTGATGAAGSSTRSPLNLATRSWPQASKPPDESLEKRYSICAAGHRDDWKCPRVPLIAAGVPVGRANRVELVAARSVTRLIRHSGAKTLEVG